MHELIYDETLYQEFDLIDNNDIPWFTPTSIDIFQTDNIVLNIADESKIYFYRKKPLSGVKNPYTAQYLSPLQKRIRCLTFENGKLKCVFGPIRETMWWYYSEGSPGSRCDDDYYNNEGLCTRFQTTTTRKTTATTSLNAVTTEKPYPTIDAEEEEECECSVSTCVKITFIFMTLFVHYLV
ncbi:hypothetical protein CRE_14488 [Caenorhabditis remanei]|uniref:Uncharacterized protein n=1 Tax=Caenorhabditis remanei TaxID=31234 RepID=E3M968_CAERE|nr:hypothetical protein CRE_14488 [Caenorhabditis remanei]